MSHELNEPLLVVVDGRDADELRQTHYDEDLSSSPTLRSLRHLGGSRLRGAEVTSSLKFSSLLDLVPDTNAYFVMGGADDDRDPLKYKDLRAFLSEGYPKILHEAVGGDVKPNLRICPVLPNGPEAAVCLLGTVSHACCAPVSHAGTETEVLAELSSFGAALVLVLDGHDNDHVLQAARSLGISVAVLAASETIAGLFALASVVGSQAGAATVAAAARPAKVSWTGRSDLALVLHTSGTSGNKKRVPYTLENLVVGAAVSLRVDQHRPGKLLPTRGGRTCASVGRASRSMAAGACSSGGLPPTPPPSPLSTPFTAPQ